MFATTVLGLCNRRRAACLLLVPSFHCVAVFFRPMGWGRDAAAMRWDGCSLSRKTSAEKPAELYIERYIYGGACRSTAIIVRMTHSLGVCEGGCYLPYGCCLPYGRGSLGRVHAATRLREGLLGADSEADQPRPGGSRCGHRPRRQRS